MTLRMFPPAQLIRPRPSLTSTLRACVPPATASVLPPSHPNKILRPFSATRVFYKKGGKQGRLDAQATAATNPASEAPSDGLDPYDLSELESGIAKAQDRLRDDLTKLRPGGRLAPDVFEKLRVKASKDESTALRLGDLAQVVPRGARVIHIMVADPAHLKPITSAIQSSDLSLTPQPDPQNALQVNVTLPAVTSESRKMAVQAASKAEQHWTRAVRESRQTHHKKLRAMKSVKSVRPDDLRTAESQMEKLVEKALADIKKIADAAKKALESG